MIKKTVRFVRELVGLPVTQENADSIEEPVKKIEDEIRILKAELIESLKHLAEVKAMYIRQKKQTESRKHQATQYEKKAKLLIIKAQRGEIAEKDADTLAIQALGKKDEIMKSVNASETSLNKHRDAVRKMEENTRRLKNQIQQWEQELRSLQARARISAATKRMNERIMNADESNTERLFEQISERVAADEALAESYASINTNRSDLDDEIDKALGGSSEAQQSLEKLKAEIDAEMKGLNAKNSDLSNLDDLKNSLK